MGLRALVAPPEDLNSVLSPYQPPVTLVSGDPTPSPGLCRHYTHGKMGLGWGESKVFKFSEIELQFIELVRKLK